MKKDPSLNILGTPLQLCCNDPKTGYYRDGFCNTDTTDQGRHVVCSVMTEEFLEFTRSQGNDLSTPAPQFQFPGLKPGDKWCLCASRWKEALDAGVAPPILPEATHQKTLEFIELKDLQTHAVQ